VAGTPPFSIAEVSERTGIPVPTLRFYEKELPFLFRIDKTRGGHRRYGEPDVRRFAALRRLTHEEGFRLSELRILLQGRGGAGEMRQQVDLLLEVHEAASAEIEALHARVEELERRLSALEPGGAGSGERRFPAFFRHPGRKK
jgi:DNA-binding transcriptional MerR regulator